MRKEGIMNCHCCQKEIKDIYDLDYLSHEIPLDGYCPSCRSIYSYYSMVRIDATDVCTDLIEMYSKETFTQIIQIADDSTWPLKTTIDSKKGEYFDPKDAIPEQWLDIDLWPLYSGHSFGSRWEGQFMRRGLFATLIHKFNRNKILVNMGYRKFDSGAGSGDEYLITLDKGNIVESKKTASWSVGWEAMSYDYVFYCFNCNSEMKMKKINDKYFIRCTNDPLCGNEYMTRIDDSNLFDRHPKH